MRFRAILRAAVRKGVLSPVYSAFSRMLFPYGFAREARSGDWQAGIVTDPLPDLTAFSAVYACLYRIGGDISKLGLCLKEKTDVGTMAEVVESSPFWRVLRKPNSYQNRIQFILQWIVCKLIHGNVYVLKMREEARGMVNEVHLIDPRAVTPLVTEEGSVYYRMSLSNLQGSTQQITVPASEVIHDRAMTLWHPLVGVSPLYACAISATQGRQIQTNSHKFFTNMSRPSGILTSPDEITEVTATRLKKEWEDNYAGNKIGKLAVLGNGLKYEAMTIPPEAAQLMQQLEWTCVDVARAFLMPLYKIGAGPVPNSANVEALNVQYYTDCLQWLIESMEECLTEGLEVKLGMRIELDLDGLLRMDSATHIKVLSDAVKGTIMTPNEARLARNLPPMAGGGALYLQQQNYSLAALAKRDAKEDPFETAKPEPSPAPEPPATPSDASAEDDSAAQEDDAAKAAADLLVKELCDRLMSAEFEHA